MKLRYSTGFYLSIFVLLLSFLPLLYVFNRGLILYDEGYILHATERFLDGEVIYKDFNFVYTPASLFVTSLAFRFFGVSIISGRILMLFLSFITAVVIFSVSLIITKKFRLLAVIPAVIYLSWGPMHINFPWPVMFAIFAGFLASLFFLIGLKKYSAVSFFFGGVFLALTFLFKHNFGTAIFLSAIIFMLFNRQSVKSYAVATLGYGSVLILFLIYLLKTNSTREFLNNIWEFSFNRVLVKGAFNTAFVEEADPFLRIIKILFYLMPFVVSLAALAISLSDKKDRKYSFLFSFPFFFYIFGIRPTTDYVHLAPLVSLCGIPLLYLFLKAGKRIFRLEISFWIAVLILLGYNTALFKGYYKWESPLIYNNNFIDKARFKIFVDDKYAEIIKEIFPLIDRESREEDYILSYQNASMFYFAFNRKNPSYYIDFPGTVISREEEEKVVNEIGGKKVKMVLTRGFSKNAGQEGSLMESYIPRYFAPFLEIFDVIVWYAK